MSIGIKETPSDILRFFYGHPAALALYEHLEEALYSSFPEVNRRVQKTQITFFNRHVFACVSFAGVKRKALLPDPYLVLTLGLPCPLESERVAIKTQAYPGRWTTHIVIGSKDDIDAELMGWIGRAYDFALSK